MFVAPAVSKGSPEARGEACGERYYGPAARCVTSFNGEMCCLKLEKVPEPLGLAGVWLQLPSMPRSSCCTRMTAPSLALSVVAVPTVLGHLFVPPCAAVAWSRARYHQVKQLLSVQSVCATLHSSHRATSPQAI